MKKTILIVILLSMLIPTIGFSETYGIDFNNFVSNKIKKCEGHFDIKPFILLGHTEDSAKDIQLLEEEQKETIVDFFRTGSITLNSEQQKDPIAVKCANFSEGYISGAINSEMICAFKQVLPNAIGEAIEGSMETIINGVGDAINGSLQSKEVESTSTDKEKPVSTISK